MLTVVPGLQDAGWEVKFAAPQSGDLARALVSRGLTVADWRHGDQRQLSLSARREQLCRFLRPDMPHLLHANSLSMSRLAGPVAVGLNLPSIGHLRDIVRLSNRAVQDVNSQRRLLAVSAATRAYHVRQGVDPYRCQVAYNGVDLETFRPSRSSSPIRRELNLPSSARLIVAIGQLGLRKGLDVAIEAAGIVNSRVDDVHWLIVGEQTSHKREADQFVARLHALADAPACDGRVHFVGARDDVPALLSAADLLVHAARQEPLGRVLLEAGASGLPIVATDVGGTREIFPQPTQATLIPSEDVAALTSAVLTLLANPARCSALASAARQRIVTTFSARDATARLAAHYDAVVAGA